MSAFKRPRRLPHPNLVPASGFWFPSSLRNLFPILVSGLWLLGSLPAPAIVDENENDISDLWEIRYNDGVPFPETFDPQADPDADGWTNALEAAAGTNPRDPNPPDGFIRPEIVHTPLVMGEENGHPVVLIPEAVTLTWPIIYGKQYTLFFSPDLSAGSWLPVGDPFIGSDIPFEYGFQTADADRNFWRVAVTDVDEDNDGLNNYEEAILKLDPQVADMDGDGLPDGAEIAAGIDPRLADTDGDGIPDNIDPAPTIGFTAGTDGDEDGIPDDLDPAPQTPRGRAPSIAVETSLRDEVTDLEEGDILQIPFVVKNPAGPAPATSDLLLMAGGVEDASASFSPLGNGRFLLTWESKVPANYPATIMRNLVIRFRDSAKATAWTDLGRFDVAEWAGPLATLPVSKSEDPHWKLDVATHRGGIKSTSDYFVSAVDGVFLNYRGPLNLEIRTRDSGLPVPPMSIPAGVSYPLLRIAEGTGGPSSFSLKSSHDLSDVIANPDNSYWFHNHTNATVEITGTPALAEGQEARAMFPEGPDNYPVEGYEIVGANRQLFLSTRWPLFAKSPSDRKLSNVDIRRKSNGALSVRGTGVWAKVGGHLKFHTAAPLGFPGLPSTTPQFSSRPQHLLEKEKWHEIAIHVGPEFTSGATSCRITFGSSETGGPLGPPQAGWEIQRRTATGYEPFPMAGGAVDITPTHPLFSELTNDQGIILAVKAGGEVTLPHVLEVELQPLRPVYYSPDIILEATLIPSGIVPDWNRDGRIDTADRGRITAANPWRFWTNDDDDSGETGGTDIPKEYETNDPDYTGNQVDGIRDLVDYFPLHFDLGPMLRIYPESDYHYVLTHKSNQSYVGQAVPVESFNILWVPDAVLVGDPAASGNAGSFLKNIATASDIATRPNHTIPKGGLPIPDDMLQAAKEGKGVALLEARVPTINPLRLEVRDKDGITVCKLELPTHTSRVDDMYRYKFLMPGVADLTANAIPGDPPNWPDADRNDKHFVFAHGYNVNDIQSRGWGAEFFKRMFWSGSNARFSAFAWYGYESQVPPGTVWLGGVSPNYQVNLLHAFGTAKSFKQYLDLIEGATTVASHSMGSILVGSAMHDWGARPRNYFMIDASAAKECYDKTEADDETQDDNMVHPGWKDYPKQLRASEWHNRAWTNDDRRATLTWKGRLRRVIENGGQTAVYNFYSEGEEVLNNAEANNPDLLSANWSTAGAFGWFVPNKIWALQEKRKGLGITGYIHSSNYGGWAFNTEPFDPAIHVPISPDGWRMGFPSELPQIPSTAYFQLLVSLTHRPFFDDSNHTVLFDIDEGVGTPGSNYAEAHRNTLISEMIPCTTYAAGRNAFIRVLRDNPDTVDDEEYNIDMNDTMKTDPSQWPLSNANENNQPPSNLGARPWLHSDIREKAFTHNWKVYKKFIELGNLNQTN